MIGLSPAVDLAWKVAAVEAGGGAHPQIERTHMLIGLLSLEKALGGQGTPLGLTAQALARIREERAVLAEILSGAALEASDLRRALRERAGRGPAAGHGPGAGFGPAAGPGPGAAPRPISRSGPLKQAFARAEDAAGAGPVTGAHLLAALLESPDDPMREVLADRRVPLESLLRRARAFAGAGDAPDAARPPELSPAARALLAIVEAQAAEAARRAGDAQEGGGANAARGPDEIDVGGAEAAAPARDADAYRAAASRTPMLDRYSRDLTRLAAEGELPPLVGRRPELLQLLQTLARSTKRNPLLVGEAGVGKTAIVEGLALRAAAGKDEALLGGKRIVELNLGALLGGTEYRGELEKRLTRILDEARGEPGLIVFIDEIHSVVGAGRVGAGGVDAADMLKPALARGELTVIGATTIDEYRRHVEGDPALERRFEKIEVREPTPEEALEILWGRRRRFERHHGVAIDDAALEAAVSLAVRFDPEHRLPDKAVDLVDKAAARARIPMLSMLSPGGAAPPLAASGAAQGGPGSPPAGVRVGARLVAEVLAEKRLLPLELVNAELTGRPDARVHTVERLLRARLVGQDAAIQRVVRRLRLAYAALGERRGPLAVFLFLGPTGVGKTELARLLAEGLFGGADELVRFDMSEYMEEHSVAKLLGASPGYVGHEQEGLLIRRLRSKPHALVLLDEVEKAHPRLFDVFLQVFEEGRVQGAQGREADARNAIFVMTSNLGGGAPRPRLGFADADTAPGAQEALAEEEALDEAKRFFRAELLNRIHEVVVFRHLGASDARAVAERALHTLAARLRERHGVELRIEPEAVDCVVAAGFSPAYGARELRRAVERLVEAPLSDLALSGELSRQPAWRLEGAGDRVRIAPDPDRR